MLEEPQTSADLPRPFETIGEPGWADRCRDVLRTYGVPLPNPVTGAELTLKESALRRCLPADYALLLRELGPPSFDDFRFLELSEVGTLENFFARDRFSAAQRDNLPHLLAVVDYCGSGDVFAIDLRTERVVLCGHDPPGFSASLPSLHILARLAFLSLPAGYYGFSGRNIERLVADAKVELCGYDL